MLSSFKKLPIYGKISAMILSISFIIFLIQAISVLFFPIISVPTSSSDSLFFLFLFYINLIVLASLSFIVYYLSASPMPRAISSKRKVSRRPKEKPVTTKKKGVKAETYIKLGDKYKLERKYKQAIEMYNRALEIDEKNVDALNSLGVIYRNQNEFDKAINVVKKAKVIDPKNKFSWNLLGLIYSNMANYKYAIDAYTHARDLDSLRKEPWQNLAIAYYKNGDYENAIEHMKVGIEEDPKYSVMWYKLAKMYLVAGHLDEAIKTCKTCLKLDPDYNAAIELMKNLKGIEKKDIKPAPKKKPVSKEKSEAYTEIGYERFLTEAINEYKNLGRIPFRGGNVTVAFRKWYNKKYRKEQ